MVPADLYVLEGHVALVPLQVALFWQGPLEVPQMVPAGLYLLFDISQHAPDVHCTVVSLQSSVQLIPYV